MGEVRRGEGEGGGGGEVGGEGEGGGGGEDGGEGGGAGEGRGNRGVLEMLTVVDGVEVSKRVDSIPEVNVRNKKSIKKYINKRNKK